MLTELLPPPKAKDLANADRARAEREHMLEARRKEIKKIGSTAGDFIRPREAQLAQDRAHEATPEHAVPVLSGQEKH